MLSRGYFARIFASLYVGFGPKADARSAASD